MAGPDVPPSSSLLLPAEPALLRLTCPSHAANLRGIRHEVGEFLDAAGLEPDVRGRTLLITAELLTNAFEAGPSGALIELTATITGGLVSIEVVNRLRPDRSAVIDRLAGLAMPAATADRGRGLPLVATLAARLSISLDPGAVRVRADVLAVP